jgi:hypothetical protein
MEHQPAKTQIIQGALIGALFLGFVGFNVGFIKGGPGNSSQDHRSDPPPAQHPLQVKVEYRWHLPLAALGCLGEALLGAVVGALLVALARRRFGERGGTIAVILVGGLGGALLGYSVGGYVAGERVVAFTAHSSGHVSATTTADPNIAAALVAAVLGAAIGSLAGRGMSAWFRGPRSLASDPVAEIAQQLEPQCRA